MQTLAREMLSGQANNEAQEAPLYEDNPLDLPAMDDAYGACRSARFAFELKQSYNGRKTLEKRRVGALVCHQPFWHRGQTRIESRGCNKS